MLGLNFLRCVGEAVVARGLPGLLQQVPFVGALPEIAADAMKRWRDRKHAQSLREEIEAVARQEAEHIREAAAKIAAEVAADQPKDVQLSLELYLSQIPNAVRRSLMRADDPTGTTLPAGVRIESADDLLPLLPAKPPRFRAGDRPACLDGRWELVELLGAGGFGEVWKGRHVDSPALVSAFKFCLDPSARERLLKHEAAVLGQVQKHGKHAGIVPLEDFNLRGETPWLRYEYVPGGDLTRVFAELKPLSVADRTARVIPLLRELASVVGHFHRLSPAVVHRDLKPANILLAGNSIRVADFGIGNVAAGRQLEQVSVSTPSLSMALTLRGAHTPLYASPQQKRGEAPDPRDDVYALGVIGFQLLTADVGGEISADFDDELGGAPAEVVAALKRCVSRDAARRPADGAELAALLTAAPATAATIPTDPLAAERAIVADEERVRAAVSDVTAVGWVRIRAEASRRRLGWSGVLTVVFGFPAIFLTLALMLFVTGDFHASWKFFALWSGTTAVAVPCAVLHRMARRANPEKAKADHERAFAATVVVLKAVAAKYGWDDLAGCQNGDEVNTIADPLAQRLAARKAQCAEARIEYTGAGVLYSTGPVTVLFDGKLIGTGTVRRGFNITIPTTLGRHTLAFEMKLYGQMRKEEVTVVIDHPRVHVEVTTAGQALDGGPKLAAVVQPVHEPYA